MTDDTTGQVTNNYEAFSKRMAEEYPRYFSDENQYGGFAIGEGWYHIIETLIAQIDTHTKWRRRMRTHHLLLDRARDRGRDAVLNYICKGKEPSMWDEDRADDIMATAHDITKHVDWIRVEQIKEKFGGLRFYYSGGDDTISGMVSMAEAWADHTCEVCGDLGKRRSGGWIRTLCDTHEQEYQAKKESNG